MWIQRKGPNSVGGKNQNTVAASQRGIHPSFIGKIDLNVAGNSDPGTSGVITPFCETYGLYFSDKPEPESGKFAIDKMVEEYLINEDEMLVETCGYDTVDDYYKSMEKCSEVNKNFRINKVQKDTSKLYVNIELGKDEDE